MPRIHSIRCRQILIFPDLVADTWYVLVINRESNISELHRTGKDRVKQKSPAPPGWSSRNTRRFPVSSPCPILSLGNLQLAFSSHNSRHLVLNKESSLVLPWYTYTLDYQKCSSQVKSKTKQKSFGGKTFRLFTSWSIFYSFEGFFQPFSEAQVIKQNWEEAWFGEGWGAGWKQA